MTPSGHRACPGFADPNAEPRSWVPPGLSYALGERPTERSVNRTSELVGDSGADHIGSQMTVG